LVSAVGRIRERVVPSTESGSEILVLLLPDEAVPDDLATYGRLVHSASSRLYVLELTPEQEPADLMDEPWVRWAGEHPPGDLVRELDDAERLFVDGWLLRRRGKAERPAEGLDWDAEGRSSPDPPLPLHGPPT
jgi:hypothetical protein